MGEEPLTGVARRLARDRLHDRLDDAVAGRRVHPGAVHGRRARPAVPRVRGHDLRRDPDLRRRVGDADADAVQPLPARSRHEHGKHGWFYRATERVFDRLLRVYDRTLQCVLRHRAVDDGGFGAACWRATGAAVRRSSQGLHSRSGHRSDRGHHRSGAGHVVSTSWSSIRSRSPTSSGRIRTSKALVSTIGGSAAATLGGPNLGQIVVHLKPRSERKRAGRPRSSSELRPQLAAIRRHARSTCRTRRRSGSAAR